MTFGSLRRLMWLALMTLGAISWSAPPACPSEAELQARLGDVKSRVDARVSVHESGFQLTVSIDDQERTLIVPSCAEALESAVFLVELAAQWPAKRQALKASAPVEPAVVESPAPEVREVVAPPPRPARIHLLAIAGPEFALLPSAVARLGLSLQFDVPWLRVVLDLRSGPPLRFTRPSLENAGVQLTPALDAQVGLCHLFELGSIVAGPCLLGSIGIVSAVGINVAVPREDLIAVWALGAGLRVAIGLTEYLELQAFASARLGPQPRYFFSDDGATAVATGMLGIDTGVGFGARW